jgi:hypothetical protein
MTGHVAREQAVKPDFPALTVEPNRFHATPTKHGGVRTRENRVCYLWRLATEIDLAEERNQPISVTSFGGRIETGQQSGDE